jgi:integrase
MSGTAREARLDSRTRRAKLKRGRQAHWHTLVRGAVVAHLGYQRWPDDKEGRWLLRRYQGGKYSIAPIGLADDTQDADGGTVLDFAQAEAKARAMLLDAPRPVGRATVATVLQLYTDHLRTAGKATADDVACRGKAHILPVLGDVLVADLTSLQIRRWHAALANSRALVRSPNGERQRYKPEAEDDEAARKRKASANRVLAMLKAALNHAYNEGVLDNNQAWAGRRVKPFAQANAARARYLTVAEAQRLTNACAPDFRQIVQAALQTGCRYSELCALQVNDFNSDSGTVAIRRSKSGKSRHVVLTDEGQAFFKAITAGRRGDAFIFLRSDGKPWDTSLQARPMADACKHASISPPISFHGLRHTWASLAIMAGMPLMVVAKNLGHVDTRMVEHHYGHLSQSFVSDAVREHAPRFDLKKSNVTSLR